MSANRITAKWRVIYILCFTCRLIWEIAFYQLFIQDQIFHIQMLISLPTPHILPAGVQIVLCLKSPLFSWSSEILLTLPGTQNIRYHIVYRKFCRCQNLHLFRVLIPTFLWNFGYLIHLSDSWEYLKSFPVSLILSYCHSIIIIMWSSIKFMWWLIPFIAIL